MSTLTQGTPALRQSIVETMACPHSYGLVHIEGMRPPDTSASTRGTEVHAILAKYAEHCARQRCEADFAYLDSLLDSVGQEAAEILTTCRDNILIDWKNFFGAEISMGLDADFKPTWSYDHDGKMIPMSHLWALSSSDNEPAYCGIADALYIYPGGNVAQIEDAKSHPRAFPADTFQGKLYALMVFMHLPQVKEVVFKLRFVRYANVSTSHTFLRSEVPQLKDDVQRVRARQIEYHESYESQGLTALPALAGTCCTYCPGSAKPMCPIAEMNPMLNMSPVDRLQFRLWLDAANRANNAAMKAWVDGTEEPIRAQDANGKGYTYGYMAKEKTTYPLFADNGQGGYDMPIVDALLDWAHAHPGDLVPKNPRSRPWFLNLRIGSTELNQYLTAKKREVVHNACKDRAEVKEVTEVRIQRAAEVDDGKGEEHREYGDGEAA